VGKGKGKQGQGQARASVKAAMGLDSMACTKICIGGK